MGLLAGYGRTWRGPGARVRIGRKPVQSPVGVPGRFLTGRPDPDTVLAQRWGKGGRKREPRVDFIQQHSLALGHEKIGKHDVEVDKWTALTTISAYLVEYTPR